MAQNEFWAAALEVIENLADGRYIATFVRNGETFNPEAQPLPTTCLDPFFGPWEVLSRGPRPGVWEQIRYSLRARYGLPQYGSPGDNPQDEKSLVDVLIEQDHIADVRTLEYNQTIFRNRLLAMSTVEGAASQSSYPPILPKDFHANQPEKLTLYPLSNYTFGTKETQPEEDPSVVLRLTRLQEHYRIHGMRRTCEGILVCHEHNHPHILMLQIANAFFKLPGDYLPAEVDEIPGFKQRLNQRLAPVGSQFSGEGVNEEWEIGDCVSQWWRPNFETFMYPYLPAHVTRPKECKKLYLIQLPKSKVLSVPKNMKLLAVPLFELYDNTARYGPQLSAIPHILSRYNFEYVDEHGNVSATTPGSARGTHLDPAHATHYPQTKVLTDGQFEQEGQMNGHGGGDQEVS